MKNYQYVLDIETPFIKKLYDKEDDYKVELLTPYGILEELKKLQEENADLEAKLAESNESHHKNIVELTKIETEKDRKIQRLKQQLAEKDKEIETYKKQFNEQAGLCEEFRFQLAEKDKDIEKLTEELDDKNFCKDFVDLYSENKLKTQMLHKNWKDKISFALEQLENCRLNLIKLLNKKRVYLDSSTTDEMDDLFDNQIKQLKEGK